MARSLSRTTPFRRDAATIVADAAVLGIDGWKSGWLAVVLLENRVEVEFRTRLADYVSDFADAAAIVVDVPVGMPLEGRRVADIEARRFVGRRASSVFPVPPEAVLRTPTYQLALTMCREVFGFGLSSQSYALRQKVLDAGELARKGAPLTEGHPEVSFTALKGASLGYPKRAWNGQHERRLLLEAFGIDLPDRLPGAVGSAPADDVLDAAAMAWTARRVARGEAKSLPNPPELIEGLPVAIWY